MSMRNNSLSLNITSRFNISDSPSSTNKDYNLQYTFLSWLVKWTHGPMMVGGQWAIVFNLLPIVSSHWKALISYGGSFRKPEWSNNILAKGISFTPQWQRIHPKNGIVSEDALMWTTLDFLPHGMATWAHFFPNKPFAPFLAPSFYFLPKEKTLIGSEKTLTLSQRTKILTKSYLKLRHSLSGLPQLCQIEITVMRYVHHDSSRFCES